MTGRTRPTGAVLSMAAALFLGFGSGPAGAAGGAEEDKAFIGVQIENDMVAGTDRHYTNGLRASWLSRSGDVPDWAREVAARAPLFPDEAVTRWNLSLGHSIFTPKNIHSDQLQERQRPYAGWFYGGMGFIAETGERIDIVELQLGIVGPSALGERVQNDWHNFIGVREAKGWRHQLKDEPGVMLSYARKWRAVEYATLSGWGLDAAPHLGLTLGNVMTYGAAGFMLRAGRALPRDYGPPLIRPSPAGSSFFAPSQNRVGWYLFAGAEARAVGRNIFLDGNSFRSSHSVKKRPFVGDFQAGIAVVVGDVRLAYTHVLRSREYHGQPDPDRFGSVSLTWRY